ncbi:MAG TPA: peptidase S1, partial [Terriglobales bacterium]
MKFLRPVLFAILLVGTFFYFTTYRASNPRMAIRSPFAPVEVTQAAGPEHHDAEEQNNIEVYKKSIPSVVNITSREVAYDFFYGLVPQEGQGSGFIIDKKGYILTN